MWNPVFLFHLWSGFLADCIADLFDNDYQDRQ